MNFIMKNNSLTLLLAVFLLAGLVVSCSKDTSTLDENSIHGVKIDTTGNSELSVYQFERLKVEPDIQTSIPEEDLTYEWHLNLTPNDTVSQLIGEEKNLDYEVEFRPNVAGDNHQLVYTVTDNVTGLEYIMSWPLTVRNNIGEGLVIAETPDGVNSDISHIMSPEVTPDYEEESVKHNVYSSLNGSTLPGLVKDMRYYKIYGVDAMITITNEDIYRINTLDYTLAGSNGELFFAPNSSYSPQALDGAPQSDVIIYNGKLTSTYLGAARKFGMPFDSNYTVPDEVAINPFNYYPPVMLSFYDEANQVFVYQPSITQFGDRNMYTTPNVGGVFNPTGLSNMVNLAADVNTTGDFLHLLKNTQTGEIGLYVLDGGASGSPLTPPAPKSFFDLSNAPGIENATQFVFLDNQKVMYYATSDKIYAMLYGGGTPVFEERYTVPAGEEITTLQVFQQADYPFDYNEDYLSGNNKQLVMSTYDGTEGKVYLLPFVNVGVGNIDEANIKSFTGFDRITAIATQL